MPLGGERFDIVRSILVDLEARAVRLADEMDLNTSNEEVLVSSLVR